MHAHSQYATCVSLICHRMFHLCDVFHQSVSDHIPVAHSADSLSEIHHKSSVVHI